MESAVMGVPAALLVVADAAEVGRWKKEESGSEKTDIVSTDMRRLPLLGPRTSAEQGARAETAEAESVRRPLVKRFE